MPFDEAREYVQEYSKKRAEALQRGSRLRWSTSDFGKLKDQLEKFNRDTEHGEWEGIHKQKEPDMHQLISVNNRIAWLCSCARDVRMQYTAEKSDRQRTSVDHMRYEITLLKWREKGLKRLKELNDIRKEKL